MVLGQCLHDDGSKAKIRAVVVMPDHVHMNDFDTIRQTTAGGVFSVMTSFTERYQDILYTRRSESRGRRM